MRAWRSDAGQTAAEYLGLLLVVSVIVAALAVGGAGGKIACNVGALVQKIGGGEPGEGCGATAQAAAPDSDQDGVPDPLERDRGTDPDNPDTDGDGLPDGQEASRGTDPFGADTDGDGVGDAEEAQAGTDPRSGDSDLDGISDSEEREMGLNGRMPDTDGDGLDDDVELSRNTDPLDADMDDDGKLDGEDEDPKAFDGGAIDVARGFSCGDATLFQCPDDDDAVRASKEYLLGQILGGVIAVGDVRDLISALGRGKWGDALWSAAGVVPAVGDGAKIVKNIRNLIKRFPGRRAEILGMVPDVVPSRLQREVYDELTGGAWTRLVDAGVPESTVKQLAEQGNDLRRLVDNARVGTRTMTDAETTRIYNLAQSKAWTDFDRPLGEALGVETALAELKRRGNFDILLDGRPRKDGLRYGPDIVAVDRNTGRTVIIEAKGAVDGSTWALTGDRLKGTRKVGDNGEVTGGVQNSAAWLRTDSNRYLKQLRQSKDPADKQALQRLEDIINRRGEYDSMVINSSPSKAGGYGPGVDEVAERMREGGQVGDIELIDVRRP